MDIGRFWAYVRQKQEAALAAGSSVGVVVSAIKALLDKANPPLLWLSVFSVLLILAGIWVLLQHVRPGTAAEAPRFSRRQVAWSWGVGLLALGACWGLVFREHVAYSVVNRLFARHRVAVSRDIAWTVMSYAGRSGGTAFNTVAGEVGGLLAGSPYRVVVVNPLGYESQDNDAFFLAGVGGEAGIVLKAEMVITPQRLSNLLRQLESYQLPGADDDHNMLMPLKRFLPNPFLDSHFRIEAPVSAQAAPELRMLLSRVVIRYAVAMTLLFDEDPRAAVAFDEILSLGALLPAAEDPVLAGVYRAAAYYYATQTPDLDRALQALGVAKRFAPGDRRLDEAEAYLLLASGEVGKAGEATRTLRPLPADPAAYHAIRGEFLLAVDSLERAQDAFQRALSMEPEDLYRGLLHVELALCYGMSPHVTDQVRSQQMIRHLEDAIALNPEMGLYYVLKGYAWAVADNAQQSLRSFARADSLISTDDKGDRHVYAYWLGRSLLMLQESPQALDTLTKLLGPPEAQTDADLLVIFARTLLNIPGRVAQADSLLDQALKQDDENGDAHRYKGVALAKRLIAIPEVDSVARRGLAGRAISHLQQAIRYGSASAPVHRLMATLYREMEDTINSEVQETHACEADSTAVECRMREAAQLVSGHQYAEAAAVFGQIRRVEPNDPDVALEEGLEWYKAGRLVEAEAANQRSVALNPRSADAHNNLAFVLFDLRRRQEALSHWTRAIQLDPAHTDALAGRAIALQSAGRHAEALNLYRKAVRADPAYLDCAVLARKFFWSQSACRAARPLIAELGPTR